MDARAARRMGKKAVALGLCRPSEVNEAYRVVRLRADVGEYVALDQALFALGRIDADGVWRLREALRSAPLPCPACGAVHEVYGKKPGRTLSCACGERLRVPGNDRSQPFRYVSARERRAARRAERRPPSVAEDLLGAAGLLGLGAFFALAAAGCWEGGFRGPTAGGALAFALLCLFGARRGRFLTAAALGLLLASGLVLGAAVLTPTGSVRAFGVSAQDALGPLALVHAALLALSARGWLRRVRSPWAFLAAVLPLGASLLFFASRALPGTDPGTFVAGPAALARLPWFAHPGLLNLLGLFPVAALALFGSGLARHLRSGEPVLLLRSAFALSLCLLSAFGFSLACLRGRLPAPGLRASVERTLAGRTAPWLWAERSPPAPSGSVAAAATARGPDAADDDPMTSANDTPAGGSEENAPKTP